VIIRYGNKLCWDHGGSTFTPTEAYSTTKTLGALVTGMVSYETRDIPKAGPKTGPFSDEDRVDQWLSSFSYNKEAKVAHVLGMVAHDSDLSYGKKSFAYDTVGSTEINSISTMLNTAIAPGCQRRGVHQEVFVRKARHDQVHLVERQRKQDLCVHLEHRPARHGESRRVDQQLRRVER
jgi:hypothetical protein